MAEPKKLNTFALAFKAHRPASNDESIGEMVEWSITAVLKTAVPRGTGGSNPSLSAKKRRNKLIINELRRFFIEWLIKICATFQLEVQQTSLSR